MLEECSLKSLSIAKSGSGTSETWFDNTAAGTAYAQPILLNWMHDRYRVFWGGAIVSKKDYLFMLHPFSEFTPKRSMESMWQNTSHSFKEKKNPINNKTKITNEMGRTGH